jgi:hypothetical protein
MEPWETPAAIFLGVENLPYSKTSNFLSVRKEAIILKKNLSKILILTVK